MFLDATLTLTPDQLDGASRFAEQHIAGAMFFDLNQIRDQANPLPRMLPGAAELARRLAEFGIDAQREVVVYDQDGLYSAPRAWWMLRCAGHARVSVLDGGIKAWIAAGGALASGAQARPELDLAFKVDASGVQARRVDHAQVSQALNDPQAVVLDARSEARFAGAVPERDSALVSGHMPGAVSLPYTELVNKEGYLVSKEDVLRVLAARGLDVQQPRQWISSCGSGVTACILALAMEHYFSIQVQVYDASWSEWGKGEVGAIVTGAK